MTLPDDPIQAQPTYAAARAAFEALPSVRVLFDNGAGGRARRSGPGLRAVVRALARAGDARRARGTSAPAGALTDGKPAAAGTDAFTWNRSARPATDFTATPTPAPAGCGRRRPAYEWTQNPAGTAVSYVTRAAGREHRRGRRRRAAGVGQVVGAERRPAGTVSEVRPDGKETFVQSGWLRASVRKLDRKRSTLLTPELEPARADAAPMPEGPVRAGHRPALLPGPRLPDGQPGPRHDLGARRRPAGLGVRREPARASARRSRSPARARCRRGSCCRWSPASTVPTGLPPCPGLRGEPCRTYTGG